MNVQLLIESAPELLKGALINLHIAFFALIIGLILAVLLALMERHHNPIVNYCARAYNTLFRGTPIMIQIFFVYYGLPLLGISFPALFVVTFTIGLNSAAYCSQIFVSGLNAIAKEQFEAATALHLSSIQAYRYIIIPQCIRKVLPALSNEVINLLKDSSLASIVGIQEVIKVGNLIRGRTYETFTVFLGVALIYLCMTGAVSILFKRVQLWSLKPCSI